MAGFVVFSLTKVIMLINVSSTPREPSPAVTFTAAYPRRFGKANRGVAASGFQLILQTEMFIVFRANLDDIILNNLYFIRQIIFYN